MTGGESGGAVNVAEAMAVIRAGTASFRLERARARRRPACAASRPIVAQLGVDSRRRD